MLQVSALGGKGTSGMLVDLVLPGPVASRLPGERAGAGLFVRLPGGS